MLCCLFRALAPDAYATPLQRVEFDSASLRLPSGTLIEGERIEGQLARPGLARFARAHAGIR